MNRKGRKGREREGMRKSNKIGSGGPADCDWKSSN
jgi:hypothetical protein